MAAFMESRTLAALRDALLSKLLSGAVRVKPERMKDEFGFGETGLVKG